MPSKRDLSLVAMTLVALVILNQFPVAQQYLLGTKKLF